MTINVSEAGESSSSTAPNKAYILTVWDSAARFASSKSRMRGFEFFSTPRQSPRPPQRQSAQTVGRLHNRTPSGDLS